MAGAIRVTPEELASTASRLDGLNGDYQKCYSSIYTAVEELGQVWKGEGNEKFRVQIQGFQNDFENLAKLLSNYCNYLNETAERYRTAESNVVSEAGKLSVGI